MSFTFWYKQTFVFYLIWKEWKFNKFSNFLWLAYFFVLQMNFSVLFARYLLSNRYSSDLFAFPSWGIRTVHLWTSNWPNCEMPSAFILAMHQKQVHSDVSLPLNLKPKTFLLFSPITFRYIYLSYCIKRNIYLSIISLKLILISNIFATNLIQKKMHLIYFSSFVLFRFGTSSPPLIGPIDSLMMGSLQILTIGRWTSPFFVCNVTRCAN